jgi:hypothetical protein
MYGYEGREAADAESGSVEVLVMCERLVAGSVCAAAGVGSWDRLSGASKTDNCASYGDEAPLTLTLSSWSEWEMEIRGAGEPERANFQGSVVRGPWFCRGL